MKNFTGGGMTAVPLRFVAWLRVTCWNVSATVISRARLTDAHTAPLSVRFSYRDGLWKSGGIRFLSDHSRNNICSQYIIYKWD